MRDETGGLANEVCFSNHRFCETISLVHQKLQTNENVNVSDFVNY